MKKVFLLASAAFLFSGVAFAHEGEGGKKKKCAKGKTECAKKSSCGDEGKTAGKKSCCKNKKDKTAKI